MKNKFYLLFITAVVLVVFSLVGAEYFHRSEIERLDFLSHEQAQLFVRPYSPVKGETNAKVFVTEYLDPECESCRAMYPFVNKLLEDYRGKIKVVIRYVPLHKNSRFAIKILEAAREQGKYWETLEVLFKYQPNWGNHHTPQPDLIWEYLPEAGVDVEKIKKDMNANKIESVIEQDMADARELKVRGTPTFFVNGKPLERFGAEALKEAVEKEIEIHNL